MIGIVNETERRQFLLNVGTACAGIPNAGEFEGSAPTPLYDHIPLPALPFGVIAKEKPPSRHRTADFRGRGWGARCGAHSSGDRLWRCSILQFSRPKAGSGSARLCQTFGLENAQHVTLTKAS